MSISAIRQERFRISKTHETFEYQNNRMLIIVRTHGLLGELLKRDVPDEIRMIRNGPSTLMEILEGTGFNEADSQWIAVSLDGEMVRGKFQDVLIYKKTVLVSIYPVFAGG